jgi:hypothetical protein
MHAKSFAFLGWMSLGSLAAAIGFGSVLQDARLERQALETRVSGLEQSLAQHEDEKARLADRANQQVAAATKELVAARQTVERMKRDQLLLAEAMPLARPTGKAYSSWVEAFSLPLGISLRLPPGTKTYADDRGLVAMRASQATSSLPWLSISPYTAEQARRLEDTLANPEPVSYLVAGNLVTGIRGQREGQSGSSYTYVLQVVSPEGGNSTHLIWAQTEREITELRIRDTLASLALRS